MKTATVPVRNENEGETKLQTGGCVRSNHGNIDDDRRELYGYGSSEWASVVERSECLVNKDSSGLFLCSMSYIMLFPFYRIIIFNHVLPSQTLFSLSKRQI